MIERPVLYLDFDHVLNDSSWFHSEERKRLRKGVFSKLERSKIDLLPKYVTPLKSLCQETNAIIVVCSSWRMFLSDNELEEILSFYEIPFHGSIERPKNTNQENSRVNLILRHASSLPSETRWCVLDDLVNPFDVDGRGVQPEDGATLTDFESVKKILLH